MTTATLGCILWGLAGLFGGGTLGALVGAFFNYRSGEKSSDFRAMSMTGYAVGGAILGALGGIGYYAYFT